MILSKLESPYKEIISLVIFSLIPIYYILNKKAVDKWIEIHNTKISQSVKIIVIMLLLLVSIIFIYDHFYSPAPPKDQLVVAISPFFYIDESGKTGSDINTRDDFKDKIEENKDLDVKIILLDDVIQDKKEAELQGKKAGAHLIIYGKTKIKVGNRGEISYNILPLPAMEEQFSKIAEVYDDKNGLNLAGTAKFYISTDEPVTVIESLMSNASSVIFMIDAFDKYMQGYYIPAISSFKSINDYENNSNLLYYIANCNININHLNESLLYFEKALEINPQLAEAWYGKGVVLDELGRDEEAKEALLKSCELDSLFC